MIFKNIKEIKTSNNYQNNIYITFDIDWASDEVLSYTLDIIEKYNIKATFFVTHETKLLERMRKNPNIELGIHPNFNPLVNGDFRYGKNIKEVLEYYLKIVPDAVSVRSHDLMQKSELINLLVTYGINYDCNLYLPYNSGIVNKPFNHFDNKLIRVPHFWEDDVHCLYNDDWGVDNYLKYEGIKVFDFHPIHIFLNTEDLKRYEKSRNDFSNFSNLKQNINKNSYGTKNFILDLIEAVSS